METKICISQGHQSSEHRDSVVQQQAQVEEPYHTVSTDILKNSIA